MSRTFCHLACALLTLALAGCGKKDRTDSDTGGSVTTRPGDGNGPAAPAAESGVNGWLTWRGPEQNGVSRETGLPRFWETNGGKPLWTVELSGRGSPVIAAGRLYAWGYRVGEATDTGQDVYEVLMCLDAKTGRKIWERRFNDYLSDIIYNRYSIGAPTIDRETGNVFLLTTVSELVCLTPDGEERWRVPMLERFGKMNFPNGRTGSPVIDGELVIVRGISSFWGKMGPGRDRFWAFEKHSGEIVWISTPGVRPKDGCFATPVLGWHQGERVLYSGTGCGNVVSVNARTGKPRWRYPLCIGGINSSVLLHRSGRVIVIHGRQNMDASTIGRMIALKPPETVTAGKSGPMVLDKSHELWRLDLASFTSSPVLAGDRVYQTDETGSLWCVDVMSGKALWHKKLTGKQIHASPLYADGLLFVPFENGKLFVVKPSDEGADVLYETQLAGNCLGAPALWDGRLYVHSTEKLYCFGLDGAASKPLPRWPAVVGTVGGGGNPGARAPAGKPVALTTLPAEVLLRPGDAQPFRVYSVDAKGNRVAEVKSVAWESYIPPTAKVKVRMNAAFNAAGRLVAKPGKVPSAGMFRGTADGLVGYVRGRIIPALPMKQDFETFHVSVPHASEPGVKFAWPPLPWLGARFKWEVREAYGSKVLAKTIDKRFFQRAITLIGHPDMKNYTMQVDVLSEGSRRRPASVGVICQRYMVVLRYRQLEINSNLERLRVRKAVPYKPKTWYRLKARVDVKDDGSGVVRAKLWPRDAAEPDAWTMEVPHARAHTQGTPGLFGFSPSTARVYFDNIVITPNP